MPSSSGSSRFLRKRSNMLKLVSPSAAMTASTAYANATMTTSMITKLAITRGPEPTGASISPTTGGR